MAKRLKLALNWEDAQVKIIKKTILKNLIDLIVSNYTETQMQWILCVVLIFLSSISFDTSLIMHTDLLIIFVNGIKKNMICPFTTRVYRTNNYIHYLDFLDWDPHSILHVKECGFLFTIAYPIYLLLRCVQLWSTVKLCIRMWYWSGVISPILRIKSRYPPSLLSRFFCLMI